MTIIELAKQLQEQIDDKMDTFTVLGKKSKELKQKLDKMYIQMGAILKELEPVDSLVRSQHPEKAELFDMLIKLTEEDNGK